MKRQVPNKFLLCPCPHFLNQNLKWHWVWHIPNLGGAPIEIKASKHQNRNYVDIRKRLADTVRVGQSIRNFRGHSCGQRDHPTGWDPASLGAHLEFRALSTCLLCLYYSPLLHGERGRNSCHIFSEVGNWTIPNFARWSVTGSLRICFRDFICIAPFQKYRPNVALFDLL